MPTIHLDKDRTTPDCCGKQNHFGYSAMIRISLFLIGLLVSFAAQAATRAILITGPITDVREDMIVIQKGKQQWEIARGPSTKVRGELRKGALVTIEVYLSAGTIDVREEKK